MYGPLINNISLFQLFYSSHHRHHYPEHSLSKTGGKYWFSTIYTGSGHSLWQFIMRLFINKFQTVWNPILPLEIHENAFKFVFNEIAAILLGELSLFHGSDSFACDWLTQDCVVCHMRRGAWNSLNTTEQTPLWYDIMLGTPNTHRPAMPSRWLQMPLSQLSIRPAATTMLIWLWLYCVSHVSCYILQTNNDREVGHTSVYLLLTG